MKQKAIIYLLALLEPMIGYATPCDKMDVGLHQKEKVRISYVIASNLKKEMPQISDVEILKIFKSGSWSMIYVGTKVSDETILFYKRDPLKSSFIAKWSGAAMVGEDKELEIWARQNAVGIPDRLAKCFAWYVTTGR
ncbi:MAG: hypothetical protein KUL82_12610 [Bdellovibrio sp.]|nr:hypothetical protein [Bdellovibrio sp.]